MTDATEAMLVEFIRYNVWANQTLLAACEAPSPEQLASSEPGTYGTIARTLEHLADSEVFYCLLLTGQATPPPFARDDPPPVAAIRAYYDEVAQAVMAARLCGPWP